MVWDWAKIFEKLKQVSVWVCGLHKPHLLCFFVCVKIRMKNRTQAMHRTHKHVIHTPANCFPIKMSREQNQGDEKSENE